MKKNKTWLQFMSSKMAPYMKKYKKAGKSHKAAHTAAIRKIAAEWKKYKKAHPVKTPAKKRAVKKKAKRIVKKVRNPIAKTTARQVAQAATLYQRFSGEKPKIIKKVNVKKDKVLMQIGLCDGILYTTRRDGEVESYIHKFSGKARPMLASSSDGKQLYLLGGKYDFTEDGIIDRK